MKPKAKIAELPQPWMDRLKPVGGKAFFVVNIPCRTAAQAKRIVRLFRDPPPVITDYLNNTHRP